MELQRGPPWQRANGRFRRHNQVSRLRLVKSRHININTTEEFTAQASKGVPLIKFLYLSQEDEITEPSFVNNAPAIKRDLGCTSH